LNKNFETEIVHTLMMTGNPHNSCYGRVIIAEAVTVKTKINL